MTELVMKVHVVTASNRSQYLDEIEEMHRHRYRLFVDLMGWRALESADRLDIDEFDNPNATYLIALNSAGAVCGSARLMPTWRPHMLKTLFPEYVHGEVPVGPGIWEWTRHAPGDPLFSKEDNRAARAALHVGIMEFAISRGIDALTGIVETRVLPKMLDMGWKCEPLGLPVEYGEGVAVAFKARIDAINIDRIRERMRRYDPVLIEMPRGLSVDGRLGRRAVELAMGLPPHSLPIAEARLAELVEAAP
jgi:N-acyl-L-homoserine lactone synthetase